VSAVVAATKGFDALLVAHILLAIAAVTVLLVLRGAAASASREGAPSESARRSFTGRPEVAGRVLHLVPLSGLGLLVTSRGTYSLSTWYVAAGLTGWLVAAWCLEGVAFPAQREVAAALVDGRPHRAAARRMLVAVEVAAVVVVVAAACMIGGTAS
jgi:hypothetical protein